MARTFIVLLLCLCGSQAFADEGMWPFDNVPLAAVNARHHTRLDQSWLDRVRLATVRISGCTGSFVSKDGLILTNHHCSATCLDNLSSPQSNLLADGFISHNRSEERRCPTQVADVLVASENVSAKVAAAVRGLDEKAANTRRKQTLTELEQACESTGFDSARAQGRATTKCESVTLYEGGQYFIYKYKRYTDVRLVFAPERAIAAFGGDPDNFQYPRWCLDMSVLRAYEDNQPAQSPNFLPVNFNGPTNGEPVFVSGHPGSTERSLTVSQLLERRDMILPQSLMRSSELRGRYIQFGKAGAEQTRIAANALNGLENSLKVRRHQLDALLDDSRMQSKRREENKMRADVKADRALAGKTGDPWRDIERANQAYRNLYQQYSQVEGANGFAGTLFRHARTIVRGTAERDRPIADRLPEFADNRLQRVTQGLSATIPIYPELEKLSLSFSLERMREMLGPDDPLVRQILSKESPDKLAARLIDGTALRDPAIRMKLWSDGSAAVRSSKDPMIEFARLVDSDARAIRKRVEDEVEAPIRPATEKIAAARFALLGSSVYPDATFTLRFNDGSVQGWREKGQMVAPFTRLSRLYERATGDEPFDLPTRWLAAKAQLDMDTPFNLSTNNDIVGGNSGSPLINSRGELVGLLFDGNVHSISGTYWFDTEKNRAVAVHPAIIRTALQKVYGADELLKELQPAQ